MEYDVIVIGSGMGGLTLASMLSRAKYNVCVLEKHFIPGGYATNFKRKGFTFDVSLHGIGGLDEGGSLRKIFQACGISDKVYPLKNKEAYHIMIENELITIPNNKEEYKRFLINRFPSEEKGIINLFKDINSFEKGFKDFILEKDKGILSKINKDVFKFISWSNKTTYDVVKKYVKDEEFIKTFTVLWMYYGLPPKKLSALYFFIPWVSYHSYGKYYIKGGAQELSNSFVDVIRSSGGDVRLKSEVYEIIFEEGIIKGVKLKNGEIVKGKKVISNVNPINSLKMLGGNKLSKKEEDKIIKDKVGCTLSQLYIGLDCNPSILNIPSDEVFILGKGSHEKNYELSLENKYNEASFLLTNYNTMDESLNEYNCGVLTMTFLDNYDYWPKDKEKYKGLKEKITKEMIDILEKYYPNIKDHIVVKELGTPRTMERYTGNPKGAVYGYSQYVNQAGRYRLKSNTSIRNFSLVGAWVNPGGGYEGSISGGIVEAQNIIKRDKNKK